MEKGYRYFGHRPDRRRTRPYEAGLGFCVALDKGDFIGRDALEPRRGGRPTRRCARCSSATSEYLPLYGGEAVRARRRRWSGGCAAAPTASRSAATIAYAYLPAELDAGPPRRGRGARRAGRRPRSPRTCSTTPRTSACETGARMTDYVVRPLDPSTWDAYARLVERHNGVFGGCWCTWFHTMHAEKTFTAEGNRELKQRLVEEGRAHAALVFDGDEAVAWCEYGAPEELPNIHHRKEYEAALDTPPDYRITCIFVDKKYRRGGVTAAALARRRGSDRAGRRRGCRGLPARHRRQEGVRPLQRHRVAVRAGRLHLRPRQRHAELRDAQRGPVSPSPATAGH